MTTYAAQIASGSTNGKGVKIAATADPGTTLHTAVAGAASFDEITVELVNQNAAGITRTVTIEWGGNTDPDNLITVSVPAKAGPTVAIAGWRLQNAMVVKAYCDVANEVIAYVTVNRIA